MKDFEYDECVVSERRERFDLQYLIVYRVFDLCQAWWIDI